MRTISGMGSDKTTHVLRCHEYLCLPSFCCSTCIVNGAQEVMCFVSELDCLECMRQACRSACRAVE